MSTEVTKQESMPAEARRQEYVRPYYEVESNEHAHRVHVYLPGVPKNQANITLEKDTLTVEASREPHWKDDWSVGHREIPRADFRLRLQLNLHVDEEKIEATTRDGVLTITLPVAEAAKPRSITIA